MLEKNLEAARDRKMLRRAHKFVFFTMAAVYAVIYVISVYAVSVLDRNNVVREIDTSVNAIITYLEQGAETGERIQKEFLDEYRTKTRVASVMIPDVSALEENESVLEEIRVAVDADEVSVFSHAGDIVASTATYDSSVAIDARFQEHLSEKNYSDAVFREEAQQPYVAAAVQLSDEGYLLQITYDAQSLISLVENASVASVAKNFPLYSEGKTALIDAETLTYLSHTDQNKIGVECSIDAEQFRRNKSKFDTVLSGDTVMVRYHKYEDYIIAAFVSYDDIFDTCYAVLGWMLVVGAVILTAAALAMRMSAIRALRKYELADGPGQNDSENTKDLSEKIERAAL
ncbi:MAG: hypothetical protein IJ496_02755 [Ruminococcus sp.]|nr:hypothetical protein [Ruminococcus sp.]